jgi:hypothetical protein
MSRRSVAIPAREGGRFVDLLLIGVKDGSW